MLSHLEWVVIDFSPNHPYNLTWSPLWLEYSLTWWPFGRLLSNTVYLSLSLKVLTGIKTHDVNQCLSNSNVHTNCILRNLLSTDSDATGVEWRPRFCVSSKFSGDADALVCGPHCSSTRLREWFSVWSRAQQHGTHLGNCQKCKFSGPGFLN